MLGSGQPYAPVEKGLVDERTDSEAHDDQRAQPDDLHYGHGQSGGVLDQNPRAPPSASGLEIISQ